MQRVSRSLAYPTYGELLAGPAFDRNFDFAFATSIGIGILVS